MTIEEIFSQITSHMIKGIMIHTQLADYYYFLNLEGYAKCHEYHALKESKDFRKLSKYFIYHHHKVIPEEKIENPNIIPTNWYQYTQKDVDTNTIRTSVKAGLDKWVAWETETKQLYQFMYKELMNMGEAATALEIACYLEEVNKELKKAEKYRLTKKALDYDISSIIEEQHCKHEKYKNKIAEIGSCTIE